MTPDWKDRHQLRDLRTETLSSTEISEGIQSGRLVKLTAEIAIDKQYYHELPPWKKAEARAVAVGISADKAVVSGMAAARLWGVMLLGVEDVVDLHLPGRGRPGAKAGWINGARYRSAILPESQATTLGGVRVTVLLRALVDIARHESHFEAVAAIDSVRRKWPDVDEARLRKEVAAYGRFPGKRKFLRAVELSRPQIGSPWETKARLLLEESGITEIVSVETQVEFKDTITGKPYFVDILINGWLVLEVDGKSKYTGEYGDEPEKVILNEREREKALQNLGTTVLRTDKSGLDAKPGGTCEMLQMVQRALQNFNPPKSLPRVDGLDKIAS